MIKCNNCGRENEESFRFCLDCGLSLAPPRTATPAPQPHTGSIPSIPSPPAPSTDPTVAPAPASSAPVSIEPIIVSSTQGTSAPSAQPSHRQPSTFSADSLPRQRSDKTAPKTVCSKCGSALQPDDLFCSSCGNRQSPEMPRSKGTVFMHVAPPAPTQKIKARLILIKPDGNEGTVFSLTGEKTIIGREQGAIIFPKDPFISPQHAEILFKDGQLYITDLDSLNGVYWKMTEATRIVPGTYFRIGRQLLRLEVPGEPQPLQLGAFPDDDSRYWGSAPPQIWARLVQILEGGKIGEIHLLTLAEVMLGREEGDVRFPGDATVSAHHCTLTNREGDCFLHDLRSSNGTFLRIQKSQPLKPNDSIQIGTQVLRVDIQ